MTPPESFATWLNNRQNEKVYAFEEPKGILSMTEPNEELQAQAARERTEKQAVEDANRALGQEDEG